VLDGLEPEYVSVLPYEICRHDVGRALDVRGVAVAQGQAEAPADRTHCCRSNVDSVQSWRVHSEALRHSILIAHFHGTKPAKPERIAGLRARSE
jgi:hypothetical protein